MRKFMVFAGLIMASLPVTLTGQGKYLTNEGFASFYSHTVIEDITADNNKVAGVIDAETGGVSIIVRMNEFQFEKKLMQEHFNENYVESEKYPKAIFNGTIVNNDDVEYITEGTYQVKVKGDLTIHGTKNVITTEGTIKVMADGIRATTEFMLNPEDYNIEIPKVVRKNIAEQMRISAVLPLLPM